MKRLNHSCAVSCRCVVHKSEDPKLVASAVSNIFGNVEIIEEDGTLGFVSVGVSLLEKVRDAVRSRRSWRLYRRHLESNLDGDTTWFYLNKQAASAGVVSLCSEVDDSPLGPIRVELRSSKIEEVIRWLTSDSTKFDSGSHNLRHKGKKTLTAN